MKVNLFSFRERISSKIFIIISIIITVGFILIYDVVPNNDSFEFIVYSLAIVYSFLFFIIGTFDASVQSAKESKYYFLKERYFKAVKLYELHQINLNMLIKSIQNYKEPVNSKDSEVIIRQVFIINTYTMYYQDNGPEKFNFSPDTFSFTWIYKKIVNYLCGKEYDHSTFFFKQLYKVYILLDRFYLFRMSRSLKSFEDYFGSRLFFDDNNEKDYREFKAETLSTLQYICDTLDEVQEYSLSTENLDCLKEDIIVEIKKIIDNV